MIPFAMRIAMLTAIAAASIALPGVAANAAGTRLAAGPVVCMTDEGQGRFKPCDAGYKAANPHWESSNVCMTDEGQGRYVPCDSAYKAQALEKQKQQQK